LSARAAKGVISFMVLGRTHRAQLHLPVHFTAPDRSKTYVGRTIDISSTGFSIEVKTDVPLPPIILAGILPTQVAGDAILCKARIVWQGGLARGIGRASYKVISIAQKSQERLDQLILRSLEEILEQLQELPPFQGCSPGDLEVLLSVTRLREIRATRRLYTAGDDRGRGVCLVLTGEVTLGDGSDGVIYGPGSVIGCWTELDPALEDRSTTARTDVRALHLPLSLVTELQKRAPDIAALLEEVLGKPATPPTRAGSVHRQHRVRIDIPRELQEIPTLPIVFNAVMDCIERPNSTPHDLAQVMRQDQSLTAKILKTVNSALYGLPRRITSVNDAVVLLGIEETANLAITALLLNTLVDESRPEDRPEPFWEHSLGTAYFAQAIGQILKRRQGYGALQAAVSMQASYGSRSDEGDASSPPAVGAEASGPLAVRSADGEAAAAEVPPRMPRSVTQRERGINLDRLFTYAVLHDIGLVVLFLKFPDHFSLVRNAISESGDLHRAELDLLEVDHCQLGYRVARAWRLPEPIPTIIAEHHLPQVWTAEMRDREKLIALLREDPTVTIISLADLMARHTGIGIELDAHAPEIPPVLHEVLGISQVDVTELLAQGEAYKEKVEAFFRSSPE
jgi:HD-like signal output (HDOD) protein